MASIVLENIPAELAAQLAREAEANHRSLTQEALRRLERTFEYDAQITSHRDQQWIDEALQSGEVSVLNDAELDAVRNRTLKG
jgi:hypothetical protein